MEKETQRTNLWMGRGGEEAAGRQWSLHALLPGEKLPFYFQLGGTLWSVSSATGGKWAQPSPGSLQL